MNDERRIAKYDEQLKVEAYCFKNIDQTFPNHFHNYYVIGMIINGVRILKCRNLEFTIAPGDIILFNPDDNHGCVQGGEELLYYIGLNIPKNTMSALVNEMFGKQYLPYFSQNVLKDNEIKAYFELLHQMIM
ncbi:MAG: AraC family ligand binding domain-containing protein, partial [Ruminococcus sp.]|nr:AraC family ligand binding domain-containing protein [Ruminococcus sp.]